MVLDTPVIRHLPWWGRDVVVVVIKFCCGPGGGLVDSALTYPEHFKRTSRESTLTGNSRMGNGIPVSVLYIAFKSIRELYSGYITSSSNDVVLEHQFECMYFSPVG